MCTVSFIPVNDNYILTSNRDEKKLRRPAVPPAVYTNYGNCIPRMQMPAVPGYVLTQTGMQVCC